MSTHPSVTFLGLGNMGGPMAANLVKAGYEVTAFDPLPAAREQALTHGVALADSAATAVTDADIVITMLPNGTLVLDLYDEILPAVKANTLFVDTSTIDVSDAQTAADKARTRGYRALDAPVSGGVAGAAAGTLAFMVGGTKRDFVAAQPLLDVMGTKVVH